MNSKPRILVAGCGSAGSRHARNLANLGVTGISLYDPDKERAEALASGIGGNAFDSVEAALAAGCDAVVVATPPTTHIDIAELAVQAGAHLLIEKPVSSSIARVHEMLTAADRANLIVMVAYNLRFLPALVKIRGMVESGEIGRVLTIHAEFGQYLPTWRPGTDYRKNYITNGDAGGGIILEESHEFDYVMWMAGPVTTVYSAAAKLSDLEMHAEDTAVVTMRHESSSISTLSIDCTQHGYRRAVRIVGTEATLNWDFTSGIEIIRRDGERTFKPSVSDLKPTYELEIQDFLDCIAGEKKPEVSGWDALRILEITLAARESAMTGGEIKL